MPPAKRRKKSTTKRPSRQVPRSRASLGGGVTVPDRTKPRRPSQSQLFLMSKCDAILRTLNQLAGISDRLGALENLLPKTAKDERDQEALLHTVAKSLAKHDGIERQINNDFARMMDRQESLKDTIQDLADDWKKLYDSRLLALETRIATLERPPTPAPDPYPPEKPRRGWIRRILVPEGL